MVYPDLPDLQAHPESVARVQSVLPALTGLPELPESKDLPDVLVPWDPVGLQETAVMMGRLDQTVVPEL